jgi:hypothetical protein
VKLNSVLVVLLLSVAPLGLVFAPAKASPTRQQCFQSCTSCRVRCHQDGQCLNMCYELKSMCCSGAGLGPGPRITCSCT